MDGKRKDFWWIDGLGGVLDMGKWVFPLSGDPI